MRKSYRQLIIELGSSKGLMNSYYIEYLHKKIEILEDEIDRLMDENISGK